VTPVTEADRQAWNAAIATGDPAIIEPLQDRLLRAIHTRIMDDDPAYTQAGWQPGG
jgi:hypothetical protein